MSRTGFVRYPVGGFWSECEECGDAEQFEDGAEATADQWERDHECAA